jgi:hypothetical protein
LALSKRLKLDRELAKAVLYQGNCSHGLLTENPHMKQVISGLAEQAGVGAYAPPNRYRLSNELLNYHYEALKGEIEERCLDSNRMIPRTTTLSFDGWDNASRTHVLGVVLISRGGTIFHTAIDTTGVDLMGKEWTKQQIRNLVDELGGPDHVAAVVLDSPAVNKGALEEYEKEQPRIFCLLCTCHVISLFLKDIFQNIPHLKECSDVCHQISKKFRAIKWLKDRLHQKQTTLPLKVPTLLAAHN